MPAPYRMPDKTLTGNGEIDLSLPQMNTES